VIDKPHFTHTNSAVYAIVRRRWLSAEFTSTSFNGTSLLRYFSLFVNHRDDATDNKLPTGKFQQAEK